ncbi:Ndufb8, NADH dehydrogenase 19kDa subunit [Amylostereum chailletii]|nr:Ndufb8, NADH dehydrogenase 19kDa subunit [Amylostereum chailletii]
MNVAQRAAARVVRASPLRTYATPAVLAKKDVDPQLNGYPQLPDVSRQTLPPKGWWDMQMRRNIGDTLHEREELYSMWGPDIAHVSPNTALYQFTLAFTGIAAFGLLCNYVLVPERPAVPREYPFDGLVKELGGLEENKQNVESLDED